MQTILGANGIIGEELAKELASNYTEHIRIVGRNPKKVNPGDTTCRANLLNQQETMKAVEGSSIAYLTVGLPYSTKVFLRDWPIILRNVITACKKYDVPLVYFDNTYMYDQSIGHQTELSPFRPGGKKGIAKAEAASLLLEEMKNKSIEAVICRAPEFYGPGKTKGITNTLIFDNIKNNKTLKVFLRDNTLRTLIYTPDAARAMALIGHSKDAFGQTWHLPCDDDRLTYKEFIGIASEYWGKSLNHRVLKNWQLKLASFFNQTIKESLELLPRYAVDNIFESSKFQKRFPAFKITSYREGISAIIKELKQNHAAT